MGILRSDYSAGRRLGSRVLALGLLATLVLLSTIARPAVASPKVPFSAQLNFPDPPNSCARLWVDTTGVVHARDCVQTGTLSGDLVGSVSVLMSMNMQAAGPNGPLNATVQLKGTVTLEGESSASFAISIQALFVNGVGTGSFLLQGVGGHKGTQAGGTLSIVTGNPASLTGYIMSK